MIINDLFNNKKFVAKDNLNELDIFAPVTTYVRLADGTYVAVNWRRNQDLSTASNSASFIDIKPLAPAAAKQLGLDQRLNDPEKKYTGAATIASGGPIQASGPLADKTINVVDIRDPKAAKDSGVPDTLFGKIAQWAQQQGQKQPGVAESMAGKVVFSGTGSNGGKYEIIQSSPTDFMIHANGKHIDTYGSLQRAMSVLKNEVPGLQQGMAEGYQLDEGAIETITALVKKIPGIGKYYQMAQQYKPQLIEILKTSKSGKEVKQKMEQLAAGQSATVAESGMMKQLGGLAVGGGSILSTMWMNAMGMIDGVLAHAAAGEVGGAVASGSILGLIPVTLMLFAAMLMFKGSNQSSDEKAQAFQAQRGQQGVAEAQTDYQKRRQRERDVDAGKPVKPLPKNPQNDYFARRKKEQGMAEGSGPVTHRIGLTVTDPNHPMVSKRKEPYQKSVRVTSPDKEKAINAAIAHHKRKGYRVHDHHYIGTVDDEPVNELDKKTVASWVRQQPERIKGDSGLSRTDFKKAKRLVDKSIPSAIAKYKDPSYGKQEPRLDEVNLGDYPKKAAVSQAGAKIKKFFGRDDPAAVAAADRTIANRTKGLARADARRKPYTVPPAAAPVDLEKQQRDLTAKYPNIDELVRRAELNRDPNYERADGQAYYTAREAEQNYQKLKQIQRVIQGLNESLQRLDEFNPFSKKKVDTTSPTTEPQAAGGMKFDLMGRPYKPAPVTPNYDKSVADYSNTTMNAPAASVPNTKSMMPTNMMPSTATAPVAKPVGTATPTNPYQVTTARTTTTPAAAPKTATTTAGAPGFNAGNLAQLPGMAQYMKPQAKATPDYSKGPTGYGKTTMSVSPMQTKTTALAAPAAKSSVIPATNTMMPTNMMPTSTVKQPAAKMPADNRINKAKADNPNIAAQTPYVQGRKGFGANPTQFAKYTPSTSATANLGQGINNMFKQPSTIAPTVAAPKTKQKDVAMAESLTWSQNFNPGRSLYRRMKQDR